VPETASSEAAAAAPKADTVSIEQALDMLQDPKCTENKFVVFGYDSKVKGFEVKEGPSPGGMAGFQEAVRDKKELLFGVFRVIGRDDRGNTVSDRNKFIGVFYRPGGLPFKMKMKSMTFKSTAKKVVGNVAFELDIESHDEIDVADIESRLRKCGGAHQPTSYIFD
jgi:hypothetical protein